MPKITNDKITENGFCNSCESKFRISYTLDDVSGNYKFCPFCGDELNFDDDVTDTYDDE